ncbi:MAG: hypothetical protein HYV34_03605 [Candidatus Kerfeldbacteria bacterium]|nr:hypothetical protein [Candidatus Kerfeldbacteria bacterium]
MKRFASIFATSLAILFFGGVGTPAQAFVFRAETREEAVQSAREAFTTERKAYRQLKEQNADDATLVIQGRLVVNAMLDVFSASLDQHEERFDGLKTSGLMDESMTRTFDIHKSRIALAREWIEDQEDLVNIAETRQDLQARATDYVEEWKTFRMDAEKARGNLLVSRVKLYVAKGENALRKGQRMAELLEKAGLLPVEGKDVLDRLNEDMIQVKAQVVVLDTKLAALNLATLELDASGLTAFEYYSDLQKELKVMRTLLLRGQDELRAFRTEVESLAQ